MKRIHAIIAGLIPVLALTAACGSSAAPSTAAGGPSAANTPLDHVTLTLNWYPYGEHAALYYGVKDGIFAKYGIDLTIDPGTGSGPTITAVGAGQSQFGWADSASLLVAVTKGEPVKSIGVYLQNTPASVQFFTSKNITSPAQIKGMTIAGTAGDALSKTFPLFLKLNGLSPSDVTIQNTNAAGKLSAVISGQTGALLGNANDQGPTIAQKTGKPMTAMRFSDYGLNYYSDGLITSNAELASDPGLVKRMVEATSAAWVAAAENPQAAVDAMAGVNPEEPPASVLLTEFKLTLTLLHTAATKYDPPGEDTVADWQATISTLTLAGLIPAVQPPSTYWAENMALKG